MGPFRQDRTSGAAAGDARRTIDAGRRAAMARGADAAATRDPSRTHASFAELMDMSGRISWWMLAGCAGLALMGATSADAQRRGRNGEAELARTLSGRVAGKPVNCISLTRSRSSRIIDRTAIIYEDGRTVYVNRPRSGASLLDDNSILVTRTSGSQLCRLDTVRLVDRFSRVPRGFVILDQFVPFTRPRR